MDESIRTSNADYYHAYLGREDLIGLEYHVNFPDGEFEEMWLNQIPEPDMVDISGICGIAYLTVEKTKKIENERAKIKKIEKQWLEKLTGEKPE